MAARAGDPEVLGDRERRRVRCVEEPLPVAQLRRHRVRGEALDRLPVHRHRGLGARAVDGKDGDVVGGAPVDIGVLAGVIDDDPLEHRRGDRADQPDRDLGLGVEDHHVFALPEGEQRELAVGGEGHGARAGDAVDEGALGPGDVGLEEQSRAPGRAVGGDRGDGREHRGLEVEIGLRRVHGQEEVRYPDLARRGARDGVVEAARDAVGEALLEGL